MGKCFDACVCTKFLVFSENKTKKPLTTAFFFPPTLLWLRSKEKIRSSTITAFDRKKE
jgi:hypothetical protein